MTPIFALFTFLNAWFVALFLAFPFSIEMPEKQEGLDYAAAPKKIHWKKLAAIATVIALLFTVTLAIVIKSGIVPVREMSGLLDNSMTRVADYLVFESSGHPVI